ncbi:glycerophosphodiester phosphodiesterase family protein [Sphingobacterium sp. SRCM116780]|uniref:glycerophosphodiester phosphodiesterase family protein n=1 Tax=Sphingobacterium sp. SRCM116780 TaxID=2907623 RepID=UPI001F29B45F|nr:glycerophosphodiester phosphodiesterase family protein [Sphingobacterium sp. SRCM116780]UIR56426.1 glycerophosphodiester phosphodiesterase family protein [Sphingobacterium sp. SRCM116780]
MISKIKCFLFIVFIPVFFVSCFRNSTSTDVLVNNKNLNLKTVEELYQFLTYDENRYPLISLHRGGPTTGYPENAIETFAFNASYRPIIVECDVRLTKDSVLVLMHDNTLDRTSNGSGQVESSTLQELKNLRLKDSNAKLTPYRIPTLEEALAWGKGKVVFTLDVKQEVPYDLVIRAIRNQKAESNAVIITYSASQASIVHNLASDLMLSAPIKNATDLRRLNDRDIPDNRIVAFIGTREADKSLINELHNHGIMCILGTLGNLDKQAKQKGDQLYAKFIENGADILSTDRPLEAGRVLDFYIKKRNITSKFIQ